MTGFFVTQNVQPIYQYENAVYATYDENDISYEDTNLNDDIDNEIFVTSLDVVITKTLDFEYTLGARAFEWDGNIVVAVLTTPFYLKSERDSAIRQMQNQLNGTFKNCNILVSFDVHVYRKIRENMTDNNKRDLFETVLSQNI